MIGAFKRCEPRISNLAILMFVLTVLCVGGRALFAIFGAAEFRSGSEFAAQNAEADGRELRHRHRRMFFLPGGMFRSQNRLSLTHSETLPICSNCRINMYRNFSLVDFKVFKTKLFK